MFCELYVWWWYPTTPATALSYICVWHTAGARCAQPCTCTQDNCSTSSAAISWRWQRSWLRQRRRWSTLLSRTVDNSTEKEAAKEACRLSNEVKPIRNKTVKSVLAWSSLLSFLVRNVGLRQYQYHMEACSKMILSQVSYSLLSLWVKDNDMTDVVVINSLEADIRWFDGKSDTSWTGGNTEFDLICACISRPRGVIQCLHLHWICGMFQDCLACIHSRDSISILSVAQKAIHLSIDLSVVICNLVP